MNTENIKRLIADGRVDKALDNLIDGINLIDDTQTKNDFILQSSRLKRIFREKNLGIESSENANVTINQITNSVLLMIDEVDHEINRVIEPKAFSIMESSDNELLLELSTILDEKIKTIPTDKKNAIIHQVELYRISKQNLESAEKASAKWGELVPSIILHRINDENEKIEQITNKLKLLL
jgi:hypothetical protein